MTVEQAWQALSLAGRQLGGGPVEAAKRLGVDAHIDVLHEMGVGNEFFKKETCSAMALGIVLGQIMAGDASVQAELAKVQKEWILSDKFMQENGTDETFDGRNL